MSNIQIGKASTVEGNVEPSWWTVLLNTMFPFLVPSVLILVMPSPLWKSFGFWWSSIYWKKDSYTSHEVISLRYLPDLRTNPLSMPKHSPELRIKGHGNLTWASSDVLWDFLWGDTIYSAWHHCGVSTFSSSFSDCATARGAIQWWSPITVHRPDIHRDLVIHDNGFLEIRNRDATLNVLQALLSLSPNSILKANQSCSFSQWT